MVCAPPGTYGEIARAMAPALAPGCIVSDVGSVKRVALRDLAPHLPDGIHLVPGHPVAGTEHTGPEAGFAELFEGRWCILTPPAGTDQKAVERMAELWRRAGMMIEIMDADHHDQVPGHHFPSAAPHRLHHRRNGHRSRGRPKEGGHQVLGQRLPRLHAHRRLRPGHVA